MTISTFVPATCITAFKFSHQMGQLLGNCHFYPPIRTQFDNRQTRSSVAHQHTTKIQQLLQVSRLVSVTSGQFLSPGREGDRQTDNCMLNIYGRSVLPALVIPTNGRVSIKGEQVRRFLYVRWCKTLARRRMMTHCSAFQ
jgi:hypothetical protein